MKEGSSMSEQPPKSMESKEFPDHWGFYLMQAINRLDDKIDDVRREQVHTSDSLRQKIDGLDAKFDQKIDGLDTKFDQKLTSMQYWYIGTLFVIIIGFVTLWLSHA